MLCKFLLLLSVVAFATAATKKDCVVDGHRYKDGQQYNVGCTSRCTCSNGNSGCVTMCPPTGFPPGCHIVKKREDCCGYGECKNQMTSKKCEHTSKAGYDTINAPWSVKVQAGTGAHAKKCLGTIMDENSIFVPENCVGQSDHITFTHPRPSSPNKAWTVKQRKQVPFVPHVKELVLEEDIQFQPLLHEINRPWSHFCSDPQCQLYLTSSNDAPGRRTETQFVLAKKAEKSKCNIGNNEPQMECLEIPPTTRPTCTNMDGSEILVRIGDTFYVMGFLEGGVTPKQGMCDTNKERYRKYINTCNRINLESH